ncbi:DUF4040 domain-containing protein [Rhodococcus triatomae]|uniref:Uncharacterized MnhB-related membrane protein n=1 Tax=Rhodococcus triatomae TaxID=300028 RepID=A0A1G8ACA3_9NOCA|nr:hydrogenase subunit MbhD domain-containing protein [Rhodococcus triatomae]QNG17805.1 DUF4040 domain-containing protein [Rhodococcus triatomae]QNG22527.1 DUF4040 domain-containing protein [Rhodococcus triatomae]SDH18507.1 Uncharacterized MnhB-related membrane protein [Rhodococcus triatomae]
MIDLVLGISVLLAALAALYLPRRDAAVMMFLVLGLLIAVVWARLGAPDIAIAEAALASGVTGALLVAAVTERPRATRQPSRQVWRLGVLEAAVGGAITFFVASALLDAARGGATVPDRLGVLAGTAVDDTAVSHPITAILLDMRAYDTLLEIGVLAAAAVAAISLHRGGVLSRVEAEEDTRPVLRVFVQLATPMVLLVGCWVLVAGSTRPGGAFQAGALLTGVLILLYLGGYSRWVPTGRWLRPGAVFGLAAFLAVAVGTFVLGAGWLAMDEPWAGTVILSLEAALTVGIGVGLSALFVAGRPDAPEGVGR